MTDGFLHRYFLNNGHRPLLKWVHYFDIYERHFERFRGKSPVMVEIGVAHGGSLSMWKEYFGDGSTIIGVDISPECKIYEEPGIEVVTGSQADPDLLGSILEKHPLIDIVLDDGSHMMEHVNATFAFLYDRIKPTGVYMVEDTHTCYWTEYGGGTGRLESFIEVAKAKVDVLNAVHTRGDVAVSDFTRSTDSICFYDSVVVFEKRPQGLRQMPITGPM